MNVNPADATAHKYPRDMEFDFSGKSKLDKIADCVDFIVSLVHYFKEMTDVKSRTCT